MKPVLILQNMQHDGPAYLAHWLRHHQVDFELSDITAGQSFPHDISPYGALAVLGGAMSANDPLEFLRDAERLILQAMEHGRPVIGHCLGGQLMARALGAKVGPSPAPEIGWQPMQILDTPQAQEWFGELKSTHVMHWHYEAFSLPHGAHWLARSDACQHQAFAIGPHLAMQFHIEIDLDKLHRWLALGDPGWGIARVQHGQSVQDQPSMLKDAVVHMTAHQRLADQIYTRWMSHAHSAASVS